MTKANCGHLLVDPSSEGQDAPMWVSSLKLQLGCALLRNHGARARSQLLLVHTKARQVTSRGLGFILMSL